MTNHYDMAERWLAQAESDQTTGWEATTALALIGIGHAILAGQPQPPTDYSQDDNTPTLDQWFTSAVQATTPVVWHEAGCNCRSCEDGHTTPANKPRPNPDHVRMTEQHPKPRQFRPDLTTEGDEL